MTREAVAEVREQSIGLLAELATLPAKIRKAIRGLDREALLKPEGPDRWSAAQVVRHLADADLVYAARIRMAIAESEPLLPTFAQRAWIDRLGDIDVDEAVSTIELLRRTTLRIVREGGMELLERMGRHPEFGSMTILDMLERIALHDERHLAQISRIRGLVAPDAVDEAIRLDGVVAAHMKDVAPRIRGGRIAFDLWAQARGPAKALAVEMPAGEAWEGIDHHEPGPEEVFVARGTFVDNGTVHESGTFIHYPAGTAHAPSSPDGCLLYVFYPEG
ncbi:MAG: DinB family protein [Thermoanaerobaculia bacterium]|jgi:hypothetical protein